MNDKTAQWMRSSMICTPLQILFGWLDKGGRDSRSM
jgi:hypothetical protein